MEPDLIHIMSADGSAIGMERAGQGPALVLVHGGTADRTRWAPVREDLAERFTLYLLDRRGRGASTQEAKGAYSLAREVEDVLAVFEMIDAPSYFLGHSYGALVGLEVLPRTDRILRALLYEPPFDADGYEVVPHDFLASYADLIAAERRDDALDLFYREVIGVDPVPLHGLPIWQARRAAAHTLVREGRVAATYVPDVQALANLATPVLVLTGSSSPPAFTAAAQRSAEAVPAARLVQAEGYGHTMIDADPKGFVDLVVSFLLAPDE